MSETQDPKLLLRICTKCHVAKDKETEFYATSTQCKACMKQSNMDKRAANQGLLYIVSNKAWPSQLKVGSCKNSEVMMKSLQTNSPFQDYVLEQAHELDDVTPLLNEVKREFGFSKGWIEGDFVDVNNFILENY